MDINSRCLLQGKKMKKTALSRIKNKSSPRGMSFPFPAALLDKKKRRLCASKPARKNQTPLPSTEKRQGNACSPLALTSSLLALGLMLGSGQASAGKATAGANGAQGAPNPPSLSTVSGGAGVAGTTRISPTSKGKQGGNGGAAANRTTTSATASGVTIAGGAGGVAGACYWATGNGCGGGAGLQLASGLFHKFFNYIFHRKGNKRCGRE